MWKIPQWQKRTPKTLRWSWNLNLLRRGRHFRSIFVPYHGRHGGLANRNAFDEEHGRVELRGLRQRPAENVEWERDLGRGLQVGATWTTSVCPLTLGRRWRKPPSVSVSWIQNRRPGKASYWNPRPWHKLWLICQFPPAVRRKRHVHHNGNHWAASLGGTNHIMQCKDGGYGNMDSL